LYIYQYKGNPRGNNGWSASFILAVEQGFSCRRRQVALFSVLGGKAWGCQKGRGKRGVSGKAALEKGASARYCSDSSARPPQCLCAQAMVSARVETFSF
jgi:hypothetical protein